MPYFRRKRAERRKDTYFHFQGKKDNFFYFQAKKDTFFSFSMDTFFHATLMLMHETLKIGSAYVILYQLSKFQSHTILPFSRCQTKCVKFLFRQLMRS